MYLDKLSSHNCLDKSEHWLHSDFRKLLTFCWSDILVERATSKYLKRWFWATRPGCRRARAFFDRRSISPTICCCWPTSVTRCRTRSPCAIWRSWRVSSCEHDRYVYQLIVANVSSLYIVRFIIFYRFKFRCFLEI